MYLRNPRVAAVVLAADFPSGGEGRREPLEEVDGQPRVTRTVAAALDAECEPVVVVTGRRASEIEDALPDGVLVEHNERWAEGVAMSIRYGMAALPLGTDAAFIVAVDMPLVRPDHLHALVEAWRPGAIVVPTTEGRRGDPVLWAATYFIVLARIRGEHGSEALMERYREAVVEVPVDDRLPIDADALERVRAQE